MNNLEALEEELVGKELNTLPQNLHQRIRVMKKDGESFFGTAEFRMDRINVEIRDGIIVDIISIG